VKRLTALLTAAVLAGPAFGYIRSSFNFADGSAAFIQRNCFAAIPFFVNTLVAAGLQSSASGKAVTVISSGSTPVSAIQAALATWNAASASGVHFVALKTTAHVIDPMDNQNTIAVGSTASDVSVVGAAVAVTINTTAGFAQGTMATGDVADSDIILNPAIPFSTDGSTTYDLQAVITHELGHALGLNHSGLLGATMFQYSQLSERYLSSDEISFASAVYPSNTVVVGTLAGKVAAADGSAVQSALVEMIDTVNGNALSALTGADGSYSVQGPAGSYVIYAEPLTGVVQAGNLYLLTTTKVTTGFQPTILGGIGAPTKVLLTAGATATVPTLTATAGVSSLTPPFSGIGKAGVNGDIGVASNLVVSQSSFVIPSGQSVDIGLIGGGIDNTVAIAVIGQGISVRPGSVRADPNVSFGGSLAGAPLMRATLDIAAHQTPALASVIVTKGSNVLAMSGVLVIVPPTPAFNASSVVNAASYAGAGVVSPGGISSIFDTATNSLGPATGVLPPFDLYGNLSTSASGVTVTFDGVPAPLDYVSAGQINFQVPFEVAGKTSTQMVVNNFGSRSAPVKLSVVPSQPAFFIYSGTVIAQNFPDYSLNTAANPIARGGVLVLYGTGVGKLPYTLATGQPGVVPPSSYVTPPYSCSFGGSATAPLYTYWYYGFVGLATWTVTVPSNAPPGAVMLTCTDSTTGASTQQGTVYIK
jgi:uncharacterized protein (TIGR03437 family)